MSSEQVAQLAYSDLGQFDAECESASAIGRWLADADDKVLRLEASLHDLHLQFLVGAAQICGWISVVEHGRHSCGSGSSSKPSLPARLVSVGLLASTV